MIGHNRRAITGQIGLTITWDQLRRRRRILATSWWSNSRVGGRDRGAVISYNFNFFGYYYDIQVLLRDMRLLLTVGRLDVLGGGVGVVGEERESTSLMTRFGFDLLECRWCFCCRFILCNMVTKSKLDVEAWCEWCGWYPPPPPVLAAGGCKCPVWLTLVVVVVGASDWKYNELSIFDKLIRLSSTFLNTWSKIWSSAGCSFLFAFIWFIISKLRLVSALYFIIINYIEIDSQWINDQYFTC